MQGCAWSQVLQAHHRSFVLGQEALGQASMCCSLLAAWEVPQNYAMLQVGKQARGVRSQVYRERRPGVPGPLPSPVLFQQRRVPGFSQTGPSGVYLPALV